MEVKVVSKERVTVYLSKEELKENGMEDWEREAQNRLYALILNIGEEFLFCRDKEALDTEIIPLRGGDILICIQYRRKTIQKEMLYCFSDSESLIEGCLALPGTYALKSSLYTYQGKYYLFLLGEKRQMRKTEVLCEFGTKIEKGTTFSKVIREHGRMICEQNCVEMFINSFKKR